MIFFSERVLVCYLGVVAEHENYSMVSFDAILLFLVYFFVSFS